LMLRPPPGVLAHGYCASCRAAARSATRHPLRPARQLLLTGRRSLPAFRRAGAAAFDRRRSARCLDDRL
jgi:hypothetical protein